MEETGIRIARQARRHKLGVWRVREALAGAVFDHMDTTKPDMAIYHGTDSTGLAIELGLVPDDKRPGQFVCLHAMPLEWRIR